MPIMSASAGFTRYRLVDETTDQIIREVPERLKRHAFSDIDHTADDLAMGWVSFENMLDPTWRDAPPEKGEFMAFGFRVDTRKVPAAVARKHYQISLEAELARARDEGRKGVSRDRKLELKEQVMLKLRARTLAVPNVFDVIWNTTSAVVYLTSTSQKVRDMFEDHFTQSFDLHLEPLTPYVMALSRMGEGASTSLDEVEPAVFV